MTKVKPNIEKYILDLMHKCLDSTNSSEDLIGIWDPINDVEGIIHYANGSKYRGPK